MILISFTYNGATIATRRESSSFTKENCKKVMEKIRLGLIPAPDNWDRYELTEGKNEKLF